MSTVSKSQETQILQILAGLFSERRIFTFIVEGMSIEGDFIKVSFGDPRNLRVSFPRNNISKETLGILSGDFVKDAYSAHAEPSAD